MPPFGDFLFFIFAYVYFAITKVLAIIYMNKFLKSNVQVSLSVHQATMVPRNA